MDVSVQKHFSLLFLAKLATVEWRDGWGWVFSTMQDSANVIAEEFTCAWGFFTAQPEVVARGMLLTRLPGCVCENKLEW